MTDRIPDRRPLRAGEYWVLSGDFHVHAFPGDGGLTPWSLRDEAARAGLDVIAVTNHNQTFTARLANRLSEASGGPLLIGGQEITNVGYHMIAVGVESTVNADQPAASAIADVHAQGGVAIAAHPSRSYHGYDDDSTVAMLDGAEVAHSFGHLNPQFRDDLIAFFQRARGLHARIAAIGASDFHAMPPGPGRCRTYLFVRERTKAGVLDAIREGRTLAIDGNGIPYGEPALVQLLGAVRPPGRVDANPLWRRASMTLSWLGAFGLVVAGRRRRPRA